MKWMLALALLLLVGCCPGITGERLKEINAEWYRIYNADRKPTETEVAAYNSLDDAGKESWQASGKPIPGVIHQRMIDAMQDYKEAIDEEAEANK